MEVRYFLSVADPDPHVFGPPGSGSISQRYGSGSGSFYHQAKKVRKTLIPTALWLFIFENVVHVPSKSNKQKNCLKNLFFVGILGRSVTKIAGSGSASGSGYISQRHGSADPDPDPHQNFMDPQQCIFSIQQDLLLPSCQITVPGWGILLTLA